MIPDEFWLILKSQPGVGVLIVDEDGIVRFCNEQAKEIYYGHDFNPVGMTIEQIEGPEFAAERMPVIRKVIETEEPVILRHVRGGKNTEALIWPMQKIGGRKAQVMAITRQLQEADVLRHVASGHPNKIIALQLNISAKTVEKYRGNVMKKLRVRTLPDLMRIWLQANPQELKLNLHEN